MLRVIPYCRVLEESAQKPAALLTLLDRLLSSIAGTGAPALLSSPSAFSTLRSLCFLVAARYQSAVGGACTQSAMHRHAMRQNDVPQTKSTSLMSDACAMQANQTVNCWKSCSGMRALLIGHPPLCSLCQVRFQACSLFWCNHHHQQAWVMIQAQKQVHSPFQGYRI